MFTRAVFCFKLLRTTGPQMTAQGEIDKQVANMLNHLFDNSLREEDYKDILEDDITKRIVTR